MTKIIFSGNYYKTRTKLLNVYPDLGSHINSCISLFKKNPDDTRLRSHPLHKRMEGKWRGKTTVRFLAIGGHTTVYPRSS